METNVITCPECEGEGRVRFWDACPEDDTTETCPICFGDGEVIEKDYLHWMAEEV